MTLPRLQGRADSCVSVELRQGIVERKVSCSDVVQHERMSNCEVFTLPCIEAEPAQVREVLRCLLHTILFNRALGVVRPREVDSDPLDLSYVCCDNREVHAAVESGIQEFCAAVERKPPAGQAQVRLAFFERRQKASWFGTSDERVYWEQWLIPLLVLSHEEALQRSMQLEARPHSGSHMAGGAVSNPQGSASTHITSSMLEALAYVTRCMGERRDHMPPVTSTSVITYPFDITVSVRDARPNSFSLGNVKKLLLNTAPPPMV